MSFLVPNVFPPSLRKVWDFVLVCGGDEVGVWSLVCAIHTAPDFR